MTFRPQWRLRVGDRFRRRGSTLNVLTPERFSEQNQNMDQETGAPVFPTNSAVLDRWRVGIVAFRDTMREGRSHRECHQAGVDAMQAAHPEMTDAGRQMSDAIGWITRSEYAGWFWAAQPRREWIWPPDHRGVGHYRTQAGERAISKATDADKP